MADESLQGPETAFALARIGAADVFNVKIAQSGGLYAASRVAAIADAASIGLYGGTMLEGMRVACRLAYKLLPARNSFPRSQSWHGEQSFSDRC